MTTMSPTARPVTLASVACVASFARSPEMAFAAAKVGHPGIVSVRAALTALLRCQRMSDLLRTCVDFTGDVDTVAGQDAMLAVERQVVGELGHHDVG